MPHVAIICNVEPLPRYEGDAAYYFGVNVSAALVADPTLPQETAAPARELTDEEARAFLSPWRWEEMSVDLAIRRPSATGGPEWTALRADSLVARADGSLHAREGPLATALDAGLERWWQDAQKRTARFTWGMRPGAETSDGDADGQRWHALLANVSRYPAPLPHRLNLSRVVRVAAAELAGVTEVVAAPRIVLPAEGPLPVLQLATLAQPADLAPVAAAEEEARQARAKADALDAAKQAAADAAQEALDRADAAAEALASDPTNADKLQQSAAAGQASQDAQTALARAQEAADAAEQAAQSLEAALPALTARLTLEAEQHRRPDQLWPLGTGPAPVYSWRYGALDGGELAAAAPVRAFSNAAPLEAPESKGVIDVHALLVRQTGAAAPVDERWGAVLESRVAELYDLGQRLIDVLREEIDSATSGALDASDFIRLVVPRHLVALVVAALRDVANGGIHRAPDGQSLAELLVERCMGAAAGDPSGAPTPAEGAAILEALVAYDRALTLDAWVETLATVAPIRPAGEALKRLREDVTALPAFRDVMAASGTEPAAGSGDRLPALVLAEHVRDDLERLQGVLADDKALAALVWYEWDRAATASSDALARTFWEKCKGRMRDLLPEATLRRRLVLGNVGGAWRALLRVDLGEADPEGDVRQIQDNVARGLPSYYRARFGAADEAPAVPPAAFAARTPQYVIGDDPQRVAEVHALIGARLLAHAQRFASDRLAAGTAANAGGAGANVSHPLVVRVDRVGSSTDGGTGADDAAHDAGDLVRQLSGVGLLLRRVPTHGYTDSQWRCLNMADVLLDGPEDRDEWLVGDALVPTRLQYQNDARQAFVAYDNHPLIARSPAARLAGSTEMQPLRPGAEAAPDDERVALLYRHGGAPAGAASVATGDWGARLPGLLFGADYDAIAFCVSNSGALPRELCAGDAAAAVDPTRLRPRSQIAQHDELLPGYRVRIQYRRRVKVGPVRFGSTAGADSQAAAELPRYPESVRPLARELVDADGRAFGDDVPLALLWDGGAASSGPDQPGPHRFAFVVRRPATDLATWHRWVASENDGTRARMVATFAAWHQAAAQQPPGVPGTDISIDDPAVIALHPVLTDLLTGKRVPLTAEGTELSFAQYDRQASVVPNAEDARGLRDLVQATGIAVTCVLAPDGAATLRASAAGVRVTLPAGGVWELAIHARVPPDAAARFDAEALGPELSEDEAVALGLPAGERLAAPLRMLLETATKEMPDKSDAWHALRPGIVGDESVAAAARDRFDVLLDLAALGSGASLVGRAELLRQAWRWQGRPMRPEAAERLWAPVLDPAPGDSEPTPPMLWEVEEFADRPPTDYLVVPREMPRAHVRARRAPAEDGPAAPPHERVLLRQEDFSLDPRAMYLRYGLRLFSRYHGLFSASETVVEARRVDPDTRWRRVRVLGRWAGEVPKPLVKVVLPLTESVSESEDAAVTRRMAPGLLVVLNEEWYSRAGLVERLVADLELTTYSRGQRLPEAGPDPIGSPSTVGAAATSHRFALTGPIGYTFDTDTNAALYVNSSFLIEPELPDRVRDPSGYFLKLRFARALTPEGDALADRPGEARHSAFTDGQWVQIADDADVFLARPLGDAARVVRYSKLNLRRLAGGAAEPERSYRFADGAVELELLARETPRRNAAEGELPAHFSLWVLVTQRITDAFGRSGRHERFVAVAPLESAAPGGSAARAGAFRALTVPGASYRVRVAELQHPHLPTDRAGAPLRWEDLFPAEQLGVPQDALARMIRVSPPIDFAHID